MGWMRSTEQNDRSDHVKVLAAIFVIMIGVGLAASASALDGKQARVRLAEPATVEDVAQELRLEQGKSTFLHTEYKISRISVGDPDVVDVKVLGSREIELLAKKIGHTNVVVWSPKNSPKAAISVTVDTPHSHIESQLQDLLSAPSISVEGAGDSLVLKGSVPNELSVEQALKIAGAYSLDVINLLEVGGEHQVMLEVVVAEMSRAVGRRLGSNFSVTTDGGSVQVMSFLNSLTTVEAAVMTAQTFLLSDNVNLVGSIATGSIFWDVFLDLLEDKGLGKVLAEPTLVARSGESASFLAGGEVPILIPQNGNQSITLEFKDFGVGLLFEPVVLDDSRISLNVSTEVSEIDLDLGLPVSGRIVPGFRTRRASTTIELADGHSFAIAGLLQENVTQAVSQYPWLGELPILGAAFRSSEFQRNETELVILVTPRLAKPIEPGPRPMLPTDHYIEPSGWEFYMFGNLEGRFWDRSDVRDSDGNADMEVASGEKTNSGGLMGGSGLRVRSEVIEESRSRDADETANASQEQKEKSLWGF